MFENCSNVFRLCPCLVTESTSWARTHTIVTAVLQWQYSQTELIFWITLVCVCVCIYDFYESACVMSLWCWLKKHLILCFYDLSAMSTACINSMTETVASNDASCVVSPVLLMFRTITSVVLTYIHAVLQRFALWVILLDEAYGDTDAWWTSYSTQLTEWLNTSLGHTEETTMC